MVNSIKKQGVILLNFKGFKVQVPIYYSSLLLPVKEGKKKSCVIGPGEVQCKAPEEFPSLCNFLGPG